MVNVQSDRSNVSMASDWHQFAKENHFWFQWRFKTLLKLNVLPVSKQNIFEIGCGTGVFLNQLKSKFNYSILGCELERNTYEIGVKNIGKEHIIFYNIFDNNPNLLASFDIVFLMDVIEHIENDRDFIKKAIQYLKHNGLIIINVPAHNALFSKYDSIAGHYRRYNKKEIKAVLSELNLNVLHIKYWGFTLYPVALLRKFVLHFIKADKIIEKGFEPQNIFFEKLLHLLMYFDTHIKYHPFGTSIIVVART